MAAAVGLAAGLYAAQSKADNLHRYLFCLLVMQAGLMGVFASIDIFFFYFFHELALIPTFIMVGIWGGRDRNYAAMKMTIYLTLGAMLSLVGLIAIYVKSGAGSFDLITLKVHLVQAPLAESIQNYAFGLLLFRFGILVSLWPLHTWAPPRIRGRSQLRCYASCGCAEKIRTLRPYSGSHSLVAKWRQPLGRMDRLARTGQCVDCRVYRHGTE